MLFHSLWTQIHIDSDHQPIKDVRLVDVLSRKQENWTLRLVANGRLVQVEGFRNRQEAYLWSSLPRKIFKSIARIIGHLHAPALKDDWDEKRKGLDLHQMPKHSTEGVQPGREIAQGERDSPIAPGTPEEPPKTNLDKSNTNITPPVPRSGTHSKVMFVLLPLIPRRARLPPPTPCAADLFWKMKLLAQPPRMKWRSGSGPMSRRRAASPSWSRSPLRSTLFSPP